MPERTLALVDEAGTVVNVIVVDDATPAGWLEQHIADTDGLDRAVDTSELATPVAPGFVYKRGSGYVQPIEVDVDFIAPEGGTGDAAAVISYVDNRPDVAAGDEVTVTVGSDSHVVVLDEHGKGTLHLQSVALEDDGTVPIAVGGGAWRDGPVDPSTEPPARPAAPRKT